MKNLLFLFIAISNIVHSQNVYIPDNNFKTTLISLGVDTNNDGQISFSEATIPTFLVLDNKNISDLTGIEAFVNIYYLSCAINQLTNLDLTNNTDLSYVYCHFNQLTNLVMPDSLSLLELSCYNNQLTSLDLNHYPDLTTLACNNNLLTSIDVSNNIVLNNLDCEHNKLNVLNVSNNISLIFLACNYNYLTYLDVSNNYNLTSLVCDNNFLTELDVINNIALVTLYCDHNQISNLNISHNTEIVNFACSGNLLTSLDLTNNPFITYLIISNGCAEGGTNFLSSLDLSLNSSIQILSIGNMTSLYEVCVWVIPFPPSSISIDVSGSPNAYFTTSCMTGISNLFIEKNFCDIYPNLSNNWINIQFENIECLDFAMINSSGMLIYSKQLHNPHTEQIDISEFPAGIYYIKIKSGSYLKTKKIIKY